MRFLRLQTVALFLSSSIALPALADGSYGRIEKDFALQLEAGSGISSENISFVSHIAAHYLQSAGLYSTWIAYPKRQNEQAWTASFGVEFRPLFLPRFLENKQLGPPMLDMLIDSLSLRMGTIVAHSGPFSDPPGFEAGFGLGLPLTALVNGPWLNTAALLQWPHHAIDGHEGPQRLWTITLGWQMTFHSGLVDWQDPKSR